MPEAVSFVRAFDQPGHVGDDEAAIVAEAHHAQIRRQRRERIVGDFGTGRGNAGDQRRLAGVWKTHQADVGQQLQLQPQVLDLTRLARLHLARGAIGRRREMRVAEPAAAAARDQHALILLGEIGELSKRGVRVVALLEDQRPDRHGQLEIRAGAAGAVRTLTVHAAFGPEQRMEAIVDERVDVRAGDDPHRSAGPPVAAARPAFRDELLAAKRQASPTAVAGLDVDVDFVDEQVTRWGEC